MLSIINSYGYIIIYNLIFSILSPIIYIRRKKRGNFMQLLVHITNHENVVDPIMIKLAKAGFHGASVVDCEGMLKSLNQDSVDAPTIFGGLRQFVNPGRQQNKMILVVLKDEEIQNAIDIIHSVSGDMKLPNTGILFTLPVTRWEVSKN